MNILSTDGNYCALLRSQLVIACTIIFFIFFNLPEAKSQNSAKDFKGKTISQVIAPSEARNLGEIMFKLDTDHDGMPDDYEIANGTDPNNPADADSDPDNDGLSNLDEYTLGTNPRVADTDGDGFSDGEEIRQGYDPLDPNSHPPVGRTLLSIQATPQSIGLSLNSLLGPAVAQLTVTGTFSDNTTGNITTIPGTTYQSSNTAITLVDSQGNVTAVAVGNTTITVKNGNLTSQVNVVVTNINPSITTITLPGFANRVAVSSNFAYVACGVAGLQIVDVSVPEQATVIGGLVLSGNANDIKINGNFAYVASGTGGLQIIDISNPIAPRLVGGANFNGDATDLAINGNFAYIAAGTGGLFIVDISNSTFPSVIASLPVAGNSIGISLDANRNLAALLTSTGLLQVIDISTSNIPQLLGSLNLGGNYLDIFVYGEFAYLAESSNVIAVKITNPASPQLIGSISNIGFPARDIVVRNNILFSSVAFVANSAVPLFRLTNPTQPDFLGAILIDPAYQAGVGITVTDSLIFLTSSVTRSDRNGTTGDTTLQILRYNITDTAAVAPTVKIVSPSANTTLVSGEKITVKVVATDDVAVASVRIKANGVSIANLTNPPYQTTFTVGGGSSVKFEAEAADTANNIGIAPSITLSINSDPGTTVIGKVTDLQGNPVNNATVTLEDGSNSTAITSFDGSFTFTGVSTVPLGVTISVSVIDGQNRVGRSAILTRVRGGITDLGIIAIADSKTTLLPTTPSALGVADYDGDQRSDLFLGFDNQQSQIYLSNGDGKFSPSSTFILPFGAVRSGGSIDLNGDGKADVLAQPIGQSANATAVISDGNGQVASFNNFVTGLSGESESIAVGKDINGSSVTAFLSNAGTTTLSVRFSDGAGNFSDPVTISPSTPLRTIKLVDVNRDGLVDIVAIKQVTGNITTLVVYPRTGATTFGSPIESTIIVRKINPTSGTVDYEVGDFNLDGIADIAVLGDDRVRIYQGDGNGSFVASNEISVSRDNQLVGIAVGKFNNVDGLVLNTANKISTENRAITVYLNIGGNFQEAFMFLYINTQPLVDSRVIVGNFANNSSSPDIVLIEGKVIRSLVDIFSVGNVTEPPYVDLSIDIDAYANLYPSSSEFLWRTPLR